MVYIVTSYVYTVVSRVRMVSNVIKTWHNIEIKPKLLIHSLRGREGRSYNTHVYGGIYNYRIPKFNAIASIRVLNFATIIIENGTQLLMVWDWSGRVYCCQKPQKWWVHVVVIATPLWEAILICCFM